MKKKRYERALFRTAGMGFAALVFSLAALPLWAGGGAASSAKTQSGTQSGERNLGGMEITLGSWWHNYDTTTYQPQNSDEEAVLAWRKEIQQKYNFKFREITFGTWNEMQEATVSSIMAGKPAASVIHLSSSWVLPLYKQGLIYPASDSSSIDFRSKAPVAWNPDVRDIFTFNGKTYGFAIGYSFMGGGVYFNKRLFEEAGVSANLPYDMQKAGTWTWDAFVDLCKKLTRDINNDGIIDVYALANADLDYYVSSNNARYVDKDASGKFVNATGRPEFLQSVQFGVRLENEGYKMPTPDGANWDWWKTAFIDGKVAMRVDAQYVSGELGNMADDWGFVMFPKGPHANDYFYHFGSDVDFVPSTFSPTQADDIMFAYNLWNSPPPNANTSPDAWKIGYYPVYRDARAIDETLQMMHDGGHGVLWYNWFIPGLETGEIGWHLGDLELDPAQMIEAVQQSWNATINAVN